MKNTKANPPIKRVALLVRPRSPQLKQKVEDILETLSASGIEALIERENGEILGLSSKYKLESISEILGAQDFAKPLQEAQKYTQKSTRESTEKSPHNPKKPKSDFCAPFPTHSPLSTFSPKVDALISIGGDGTLISAVHKSVGSHLPIFGINMGHLGFLTAINPSELESFAKDLAQGNYVLDSHKLLEGRIVRPNGEISQPFYALNEILITKKDISGMIHIDAMIEGEFCNSYRADGLIIATPTGSSAYNISAGGSVVHPRCQVLLLTPVCAHSLTQRPMVISDEWELAFRIHSTHISPSKDSAKLIKTGIKTLQNQDIEDIEGMIMIDGQQCASFKKGEVLEVRASTQVNLIQHPNRSYFAILREKFGLGSRI